MTGFDDLDRGLSALRRRQLYRQRRTVESPMGRELRSGGRALLNFCSNDYLGLAADPRVRVACREGIDRWGVGTGGSHLVTGHTAVHRALEEAIAGFLERPRALVFSSGYAANLGVINALAGPNDLVCQDRLNHASLLDGARLAGCRVETYAHADPADLAARLEALCEWPGRCLIVTDGTFSMDGDLCPLAALADLAKGRNGWLLVDDAHGIGVHGPGGRGVVDPARFDTTAVPVLVGTFGKALGTAGAFVAGSESLIETLIQRARTYIYTTALPAAIAAATLASLAIVREEPWRRERLGTLIDRFRGLAGQAGLTLLPSATPIQPILLGDAGTAVAVSAALERRGFLVAAIRPPTVPPGTARLRVTLSAAHEPADVDALVTALAESVREAARSPATRPAP